jgi:hypothetical protein
VIEATTTRVYIKLTISGAKEEHDANQCVSAIESIAEIFFSKSLSRCTTAHLQIACKVSPIAFVPSDPTFYGQCRLIYCSLITPISMYLSTSLSHCLGVMLCQVLASHSLHGCILLRPLGASYNIHVVIICIYGLWINTKQASIRQSKGPDRRRKGVKFRGHPTPFPLLAAWSVLRLIGTWLRHEAEP